MVAMTVHVHLRWFNCADSLIQNISFYSHLEELSNSQFSRVPCSVVTLYSVDLAIHDILKGVCQGVVLIWGQKEN